MRRGLYRVQGIGNLPADVRMEDNGIETPLEESLYRARGYLPLVDDLPWQEDYFGKRPSPESGSSTKASTEKAAREQARQDFLARFRKP